MESVQVEINKSRLAIGVILTALLVFGFMFLSLLVKYLSKTEIPESVLFWISRFGFWICLLLVLLWSVRIEKNPLLIWKERPLSFPEGLATGFGLFGAVMIGMLLLSMTLLITGYKEDHTQLKKIVETFRNSPLLLVFTVITAGAVEELIFRGYLLPRMAVLFKNTTAAILVSSLLFGLLHFGYGNISQIVGPFWIGLVFALYYNEYRNIKALIIFHSSWDLLVLLVQIFIKK